MYVLLTGWNGWQKLIKVFIQNINKKETQIYMSNGRNKYNDHFSYFLDIVNK